MGNGKFNSLWDRLMFSFRLRKLREETATEYLETLERQVKFWQDEAFRQSNECWRLKEELQNHETNRVRS